MNMTSKFCVTIGAALMLGGPACVQQAKAATKQVTIEGVGAVEVTTITASVEAVDQKNRIVTIKGPRGNVFAVPVSERVKNLPQVKAGDTLQVDYLQAVAIELKSTDGAPTLTETGAIVRAKEGRKPAGVKVRKVRVVTSVLGINTENQSVLVRGPLGHLTEVRVQKPEVLATLKQGGQIDLTYVEGVAIGVRGGKAG